MTTFNKAIAAAAGQCSKEEMKRELQKWEGCASP